MGLHNLSDLVALMQGTLATFLSPYLHHSLHQRPPSEPERQNTPEL